MVVRTGDRNDSGGCYRSSATVPGVVPSSKGHQPTPGHSRIWGQKPSPDSRAPSMKSQITWDGQQVRERCRPTEGRAGALSPGWGLLLEGEARQFLASGPSTLFQAPATACLQKWSWLPELSGEICSGGRPERGRSSDSKPALSYSVCTFQSSFTAIIFSYKDPMKQAEKASSCPF